MKTSHLPPILFIAFIGLDAAALAVLFVLGLAAAKPSHTPVPHVLGLFLLPALVLAGVAWLYWCRPWPAARAVAMGVAALPVVVALGGTLLTRAVTRQLSLPVVSVGTAPSWFAALSPTADPAVLPALLERGAELRAMDMAGRAALQVAADDHANWAAVALLIERGADWQAMRSVDGSDLRQRVNNALPHKPGDATLQRLQARLGGWG